MKTIVIFFVLFLTPVSAFAQEETLLERFGIFVETVRELDVQLKEQDRNFASFVNSYRDVLMEQKKGINLLLDAAARSNNPQDFTRFMNQAEYRLTKVYQNLELSCPNEWAKYNKLLEYGVNRFRRILAFDRGWNSGHRNLLLLRN